MPATPSVSQAGPFTQMNRSFRFFAAPQFPLHPTLSISCLYPFFPNQSIWSPVSLPECANGRKLPEKITARIFRDMVNLYTLLLPSQKWPLQGQPSWAHNRQGLFMASGKGSEKNTPSAALLLTCTPYSSTGRPVITGGCTGLSPLRHPFCTAQLL